MGFKSLMRELFNYSVNNREVKFYFSTNWSIEISGRIEPKLKIKNDYDLARYILYYCQFDYKTDNCISIEAFQEISNELLESMFCDYLNSDKEFLLQNKINHISNIQEGITELKRNIFDRDKQLNLLMTASVITFRVDQSWLQSLMGKFNQEQLNIANNSIQSFSSEILPKIRSLYETYDVLEYIEEFPTKYNSDYFNHLFKVSNLISRLTKFNLWIPSRFIHEIWNRIVGLEFEVYNDNEFSKTIFNLFTDAEIKHVSVLWCNSELLSVKSSVIEEMFFCFIHNKFYATIVLGLTIVDFMTHKIYILTEGAKKKLKYTGDSLLDELQKQIKLILNSSFSSDYYPNSNNFHRGLKLLQIITLTNYLKDTLFYNDDFDLIQDVTSNLNRNGILHGKLSKFGTKENALRIIILIDDLLEFYNNYINKPKQL